MSCRPPPLLNPEQKQNKNTAISQNPISKSVKLHNATKTEFVRVNFSLEGKMMKNNIDVKD